MFKASPVGGNRFAWLFFCHWGSLLSRSLDRRGFQTGYSTVLSGSLVGLTPRRESLCWSPNIPGRLEPSLYGLHLVQRKQILGGWGAQNRLLSLHLPEQQPTTATFCPSFHVPKVSRWWVSLKPQSCAIGLRGSTPHLLWGGDWG